MDGACLTFQFVAPLQCSHLMLDASHRNIVLSYVSSALEAVNEVLASLQVFAQRYMSTVSIPGMDGFVERADMEEWNQQDQTTWLDAIYR